MIDNDNDDDCIEETKTPAKVSLRRKCSRPLLSLIQRAKRCVVLDGDDDDGGCVVETKKPAKVSLSQTTLSYAESAVTDQTTVQQAFASA